jgi:hypothetical protein
MNIALGYSDSAVGNDFNCGSGLDKVNSVPGMLKGHPLTGSEWSIIDGTEFAGFSEADSIAKFLPLTIIALVVIHL